MQEWLIVLLVMGALIALMIFFAWVLGAIVEEIMDANRRTRQRHDFSKRLAGAAITSQPSWSRIADIADLTGIRDHDQIRVYRETLMAITTGEAPDLAPHENLIEGYLQEVRKRQPFEGMPEQLRVPLEKLRQSVDLDEEAFEPLTDQIRDLLEINSRDKTTQRFYTIGGFFVGLTAIMLWLADRIL